MNANKHRSTLLLITGFLTLPLALDAQPFLYNQAKDQKAQLADAAAKEIAGGALFNTEIQNLKLISKLEIQRVISFGQVQFKSGINAFGTWKDVSDQMEAVKNLLARSGTTLTQAQAADRVKEVKDKVDKLTAVIAELGKASGTDPNTLEELGAHLKTASSVLAFAEQLPKENQRFSAAVEHIKTWLDTVMSFYDSFAAAAAVRKEMREALGKLSSTPEADELRLLRLEIEHLNWIGQNAAREELETGYVLNLMDEGLQKLARNGLSTSTESIEITLSRLAEQARSATTEMERAAARERLFFLLIALHEAAAARAQGGLPKELAALRDTQQEWTYSILRSSARVQSSEQTMQQAATRLALYYKGGIKPAQLAQLLYNLSGLVSLPVIATK